jgi:exosome complex component RRP4
MITFTSFPVPSDYNTPGYGTARHRPDVEEALMDLDDDFEVGGSKLTCPGEYLTSAQGFMR